MSETEGSRPFHYVITLQWTPSRPILGVGGRWDSEPMSSRSVTVDGVVEGACRSEMYRLAVADAADKAGVGCVATPAVLFWSLEPDDLAGG